MRREEESRWCLGYSSNCAPGLAAFPPPGWMMAHATTMRGSHARSCGQGLLSSQYRLFEIIFMLLYSEEQNPGHQINRVNDWTESASGSI